jgi:hypothetical protein
MTIVIHFHQAHYRNFKAYYLQYVAVQLRSEFPQLVSYQCFVELLPTIVVPLCAYLTSCFGTCTGLSFIDSSALAVCHHRRISQHTVLLALPNGVRPPSVGFTASNCISSSMIEGNCLVST